MAMMDNWPVDRQPIFSERLMIQKLMALEPGESQIYVHAVLDALDKPKAGRLVYLPWGAGSKCVPGFQNHRHGSLMEVHDDEDIHGGRC